MPDFADIKAIRNFKSLVKYLRKDLGWPIDEDQADDLVFEYTPQELDLAENLAVKIREIKQVRPLVDGQPWGIFWIDFEPKRLPVVVMRRILSRLVTKKRSDARHSRQATWNLRDLMFVSATGEGNARGISFAHFRETPAGQPQLRTFSWDAQETHLHYIQSLNLAALRWPSDPTQIEHWREQWAGAFISGHRETIQTARELASRMAQLAAATRAAVNDVLAYERANGPLHKLHDSFRKVLIHDLSEDDFADMYAQTVTYGLFSARATRSGKFARENVLGLIPNTNPFLRELLEECLKVGSGGRRHQIDLDELGIDELVETLQNTNMEAVMYDFGKQSRDHKEDPVVHFYESFLKEYDAEKQMKRGVIYTPDPVVQFIVRSIDHLLRTRFDCADGVADTRTIQWKGKTYPKVLMLDPAVGTGTFDEYMIRVIHETFQHKHRALKPADRQAKWNEYVAEHLLPRLYGFELMMAPYAVAHMKLGLVLKELGYDFKAKERLHIYLTNTLVPTDEVPRIDVAFLAHEAEKAHEVKEELPVTVVYGNPPYAGHSANASKNADGTPNFIGRLLRDYYQVDGKPLGERNPKWLQDDYVKFMRYGQWRIEQTGSGILAMITNHGYLDNPTFRGMRQQLMQTFDEIYVLDLHGNSKKKEVAPDGSPDENVFDIMQGVAICLMVKHRDSIGKAKVYHAHLRGNRDAKYQFLGNNDMQQTEWQPLKPQQPFYLFVPQDVDLRTEYQRLYKVTDALPVNVLGFQTHRDDFAVSFERSEIRKRIRDMRGNELSDKVYAEKYSLVDNRDWQLKRARNQLRHKNNWEEDLIDCLYRSFDWRPCYFSEIAMDYPRRELMQHVSRKDNLILGVGRQGMAVGEGEWSVVCCAKQPVDANIFRRGGVNLFPIYLYPSEDDEQQFRLIQDERGTGPGGRKPNLAPNFIRYMKDMLHVQFVEDGTGDLKKTIGPEDIFHYIYAVLHSPIYRERYADFLKIDFPRVPITSDIELFRTLAKLGKELVALHLMEAPKLNRASTRYIGQGDDGVAAGYPTYEDETVWINDTQGFKGVPEDVWDFHIGGFQVCHKWLKDRRGRELSAEDKAHYAKIVVALQETMRLMEEIDAAIPAWPIK